MEDAWGKGKWQLLGRPWSAPGLSGVRCKVSSRRTAWATATYLSCPCTSTPAVSRNLGTRARQVARLQQNLHPAHLTANFACERLEGVPSSCSPSCRTFPFLLHFWLQLYMCTCLSLCFSDSSSVPNPHRFLLFIQELNGMTPERISLIP